MLRKHAPIKDHMKKKNIANLKHAILIGSKLCVRSQKGKRAGRKKRIFYLKANSFRKWP